MTFLVFEYDSDTHRKHSTNKEFTVTLQKSNEQLRRLGYADSLRIEPLGVMMIMFKELYGFTSRSGHALTWVEEFISATISWHANVFFIKRVRYYGVSEC